MHRSSLHTSLLAMTLVALSGCTGTDIELTESATTQLNMTSPQPSNPEATSSAASIAAAATAKMPLIDVEAPTDFQTATFALGWFWGPDSRFGSLEGVVRTRVGYCGGSTKSPTYRSIGDHAESIQIDFDPKRISYEQLLELFWTTHNPCRNAWSRQYMSAVFYHDEAQRKAIDATRRKFVKMPDQVQTEITALEKFWIAEDYHQKYRLRHEDALVEELQGLYPKEPDFINSTAAARLNGYLDGHGTSKQLDLEIEKLGLSAKGQALLRQHVR